MELTPKQQATELIRQANKILLVTGRELNNDQLSSIVALATALTKLGKEVHAIVTDPKPKAEQFLDLSKISPDLNGMRDFVISLNLKNAQVERLNHEVIDGQLKITITPQKGNFTAGDTSYSYGAFQFDLVVVLGVANFAKIDKIIDSNPTLFDGLHLVNIDYHRINESYGSVNLLDQNASSVAEILVSLIESLEQGLIDAEVATALLTGIMAATNRFTAPNTTPKSLTVAAQLLAAGARREQIVKALYNSSYVPNRPQNQNQNQPSAKPEQSLQSNGQTASTNQDSNENIQPGPFKGRIN